ncbi:MAG: flagellar hook-length control protein FliK [Burkholderiaceae bacterium]|nr:flagellar hook-length control protein FliK [Burkholderiaceae bacterium]
MADILIAPQTASAVPPVSGRGKDPGTHDAAPDNMDAGASPTFATVLKSRSETVPADTDKQNPAEVDSVFVASNIAPPEVASAVLSLLRADSSLGLRDLHQVSLTGTATAASLVKPSADRSDPELLTQLPSESPEFPLSRSLIPPTSASTASPISPAPAAQEPPRGVGASAGLLRERSFVADKLAAKAAIAADTGVTGKLPSIQETGSGDFSDIMDQMAHSATTNSLPSSLAAPATSATSTAGMKLETPLGHAGWRDEFGQKLTWMVSNSRQQAEIVLNPPQLGRIEVTLTLDGDRASALFVSPHAAVREALESSMIRLREVLADAGVTLGQTHVGAEARRDPDAANLKHDEIALVRKNAEQIALNIDAAGNGARSHSAYGRGMVDVFA